MQLAAKAIEIKHRIALVNRCRIIIHILQQRCKLRRNPLRLFVICDRSREQKTNHKGHTRYDAIVQRALLDRLPPQAMQDELHTHHHRRYCQCLPKNPQEFALLLDLFYLLDRSIHNFSIIPYEAQRAIVLPYCVCNRLGVAVSLTKEYDIPTPLLPS